jgi:predicted house-cleaning noncanonical NTP pyrophosphatase (MazG superfamily)
MTQDRAIAYGKLVRDRIPEIISAGGGIPQVRVLDLKEFFPALIEKLHEEAEELRSAGADDVLGELADLREVLAAATTFLGLTAEQVELAAAGKRRERGAFGERLWLDEVAAPTSAESGQ